MRKELIMTLEERVIELENRIALLETNVVEKHLTPKELADWLNCSTNTIYVKIREGKIKTARNLGTLIRIPMSQFKVSKKKQMIRDEELYDEIDLMRKSIWN